MIDNASIEKLKTSIDIVDVVGNYIELKKAGANFKANCPFHGEKTPSFVVSPQKQIFHCFGCGAGGDAIKFVMEIEKLSYPEAIEKLASNYNISLNYTKGKSSFSDEKRVLEILEQWYKSNLVKNSSALEYLKQRGIAQKSIERFGLGYVGDSSEVISCIKANQLPLPKAVEAGVIAVGSNNEYYARLTQRVIFPIYNQAGSIIGFGGRTLSNHPAKYINSPQTKLFDKSRVLYGYHLAKKSIYEKREIIITEGYLDVIMLHQAGFSQSVATLGTALTASHLPIIKKSASKVILAYDGDKAGVAAAFKAAKMLSSSGFEGRVVLFPDGKDPADMVAQNNLEELNSYLNGGLDLVVFVIEHIKNSYDINNPYQKQDAINEIKAFLNTLSPILKESYAQEAARRLNVKVAFFASKSVADKEPMHSNTPKKDPAWEAILKSAMENPGYIDELLNVLDFHFAKGYEEAFRNLANSKLDDPILRGIAVDDSIKVLNPSEFKAQVLRELTIYYTDLLKRVISTSNLDYKRKSFLIRKIKTDILPRLKKGEYVAYESDFII
jgi:DNA primase